MNKKYRKIDLNPGHYDEICGLLARYLPHTLVWAFGSRVKLTAHVRSDLDLVAFANPAQSLAVYELNEAFEQSALPFRIDLLVWDELPETFHQNIIKSHYVLQSGKVS